jgi:hypothetical protein
MLSNNEKLIELIKKNNDKQIILYGAASRGIRVFYNLIQKGVDKNQILFCDSNKEKWHTKFLGTEIISKDELLSLPKDVCIIISSSMHYEILPYLNDLGFTNVNYFYSLLFTEQMLEKYKPDFLKIMNEIGNKRGFDYEEAYTLYSSVKAVKNLSGSMAEVGVYQGSSAKLIAEIKNDKNFYLFDTFEGLPKTTQNDEVKSGWLSNTSLDSVKQYLSNYENLFFHKGYFPQTARNLTSEKFCLVHLDTDLYLSTLDSLEFFWPKMVKEGRIISHDYNASNIGGVKQAFEEFFKDSPEKIIEIADTQSMVIK